MTEWKIKDMHIKALLDDKLPSKYKKGYVPKVIHFAIVDYDSQNDELKYLIRTSTFIVDNPQEEQWNESYKSWLTLLEVNGFKTWAVLFF